MDKLINNYIIKLAQAEAAAEEALAAQAALNQAAVAQETKKAKQPDYEKRRRVTARILATLALGMYGGAAGFAISGGKPVPGIASALAGGAAGYGLSYFGDKVLGLNPLVNNVSFARK